MTLIAVGLFVWASYLVTQYGLLTQQVALAFEAYDGTCCQEHSLYDVIQGYQRLRVVQWAYLGMVTLLHASVF